jgi:hypothetical protein
MANHTPGPWSVEDEREDRIAVRSEDGALIADCCDGHYNDNGEFIRAAESLPNARLIAAAPDLKAVVQQLVNAHAKSESATKFAEWCDEFIEEARAAIAKATGAAA